MRSILAALLALSGFLLFGSQTAQAVRWGEQAPDFELVDTEGTVHTLEQYRGQVVFVNFFGFG